MTSEAQKRAVAKYDAANTLQLKIKLNKKTDNDIIVKLNEVDNKAAYVKSLIRKDFNSDN